MDIGHHDDLTGDDEGVFRSKVKVLGQNQHSNGVVMCNDSQEVRYQVNEQDADSDFIAIFTITGYWMWE